MDSLVKVMWKALLSSNSEFNCLLHDCQFSVIMMPDGNLLTIGCN